MQNRGGYQSWDFDVNLHHIHFQLYMNKTAD